MRRRLQLSVLATPLLMALVLATSVEASPSLDYPVKSAGAQSIHIGNAPQPPLGVDDPTVAVEFEKAMPDLRALFPELNDADIRARSNTSYARHVMSEKYANVEGFGGLEFDFASGTLNLYIHADDHTLQDQLTAEATSAGVEHVVIHHVIYDQKSVFANELAVAAAIDKYPSVISRSRADNSLRVEIEESTPKAVVEAVAAVDGVTEIRFVEDIPKQSDSSCQGRLLCSDPIRGGIEIFKSGSTRGSGCSIGFSAKGTDNHRYVYSAGHCLSVVSSVLFYHGQNSIGQLRQTRNTGSVDAALVHIDNTYWGSSGGWIYYDDTQLAAIHYAITSYGTIQVGDVACIGGRNLVVGDDNCGVIAASHNTDPYAWPDQRPYIYDVKNCGGDSGGTVYALVGSERWAYGLVSGGDNSNHGGQTACSNSGPTHTIFSAIPYINAWIDSVTTNGPRVETQ